MNKFLMLGTSDKTYATLLFAQVLQQMDQRVLLVDATQQALYRYGYTDWQLDGLYDFHGIDILSGHYSWATVQQSLPELERQYDIVIVDVDHAENMNQWGAFDEQIYVGVAEPLYLKLDSALLRRYVEATGANEFKKLLLHWGDLMSEPSVNFMIGDAVEWTDLGWEAELSSLDQEAKIQAQFNRRVELKKASKEMKLLLQQMVSLFLGVHSRQVKTVLRPRGLFSL